MIVDNFNAENTDVQAELVQVVGDETDTTKLMTAVRGGIGPDVYMLDRFIVAQRAAEGVLQDLSEFMAGEDFSEVYIPFAWAEANFHGSPYALPFDTDARALFYNKGMLAGSRHRSRRARRRQRPDHLRPAGRDRQPAQRDRPGRQLQPHGVRALHPPGLALHLRVRLRRLILR